MRARWPRAKTHFRYATYVLHLQTYCARVPEDFISFHRSVERGEHGFERIRGNTYDVRTRARTAHIKRFAYLVRVPVYTRDTCSRETRCARRTTYARKSYGALRTYDTVGVLQSGRFLRCPQQPVRQYSCHPT
jgi:hypothetical protein